ncbi:hypothetical protein [Govanella unica]|uniref:Uncharacterized protein n=1 Tax=Govanella unica TaxID=2975056 RepID=A0A9X3Z629_9PROT|nr:hypothetical protein [Govania unica]MDA5192647.1 hypothetical protein [Govania unica]
MRQEQELPSRKFVKDRELARHFPNLVVAELLRTDGQYRILAAGQPARRFWARDAGAVAEEMALRGELLLTLMRHLSANRLAVVYAGTAMIGGDPHSFHLLALPLAEDGYEMDAAMIEVAFAPLQR